MSCASNASRTSPEETTPGVRRKTGSAPVRVASRCVERAASYCWSGGPRSPSISTTVAVPVRTGRSAAIMCRSVRLHEVSPTTGMSTGMVAKIAAAAAPSSMASSGSSSETVSMTWTSASE